MQVLCGSRTPLAASVKRLEPALLEEASVETLETGGFCVQQLLPRPRQVELLFVDMLLGAVQLPANAREGGFWRYCRESALRKRDGIAASAQKSQLQRLDALFHAVLQRCKQLGRGGWGWGAQIGNEISDGEVRFVSNRGDYGDGGVGYRSREDLGIKRGKVLGRAATAGKDNCIHRLHAIEMKNAGGEFSGCLLALHRCRVKQYVEASVAAADDVEEVVNNGARGRCDDTDAAGEGREGAFAVRVEEAFFLQLLFQLLKRELQRAGPDGFERLSDELKLTAFLIDRDAATRQDVQRSLGTKAQESRLSPEKDHGKLALFIFQGEIDMSRCGAAQI
jgi:hypothetical protein